MICLLSKSSQMLMHKPQDPHPSHIAAGAVKTSPIKIKKEGYGGKGSWGSTRDEINYAKLLVQEGELPPVSSPEKERSMRKVTYNEPSCRRSAKGW